MTDKEKLDKLVAEIERLYNQSLVDENRQAEWGLSSAACTSYGKSKVCKELLSLIDSMQEEPKYKFKAGDKVMPKRFTDNECGFYIDNSARIVDIVGDYYILEGNKAYKIACQDNWELVEETAPHRPKVTDGEATGKLKECIDNITEESLTKARKLLQEEPVSEDLEQAIDTYLATYFGGEKEKQEWPFLKKMAIYFANWQKKKNDYAIEIAHMAGEEEGKNIMKQQIMAKAVD